MSSRFYDPLRAYRSVHRRIFVSPLPLIARNWVYRFFLQTKTNSFLLLLRDAFDVSISFEAHLKFTHFTVEWQTPSTQSSSTLTCATIFAFGIIKLKARGWAQKKTSECSCLEILLQQVSWLSTSLLHLIFRFSVHWCKKAKWTNNWRHSKRVSLLLFCALLSNKCNGFSKES